MVPELIEDTDFRFDSQHSGPAGELIDNLEHALRYVATLPSSPLLAHLAQQTIANFYRIEAEDPIALITDAVARYLRVDRERLLSKSRSQHIAFCRQLAMYLCRRITHNSFPAIAAVFHRDHSTAMHAFKVIQRRIERDRVFGLAIEKLGAELIGTVVAAKALPNEQTPPTAQNIFAVVN